MIPRSNVSHSGVFFIKPSSEPYKMLNDDYGQRASLAQAMKSGGNWFFWIAGLSLITSVLSVSGSNWRFFPQPRHYPDYRWLCSWAGE